MIGILVPIGPSKAVVAVIVVAHWVIHLNQSHAEINSAGPKVGHFGLILALAEKRFLATGAFLSYLDSFCAALHIRAPTC